MKVIYKNEELILPDFMIVGAPKAWSTSLFYYLDQHPRITFTAVKEPHYFSFKGEDVSRNKFMNWITWDITTYQSWMPVNDLMIWEWSVNYLSEYKTVIPNIKEVYGDQYKKLKIIILLRNPSDRARSHYMHFIRDQRESLLFEEAITPETIASRSKQKWNFHFYDYIGKGMYSSQVENYINEFPLTKTILFEELISETNKIIWDLTTFLGVDDISISSKKIYNRSGEIKNPIVKKIYGRYNQKNAVWKRWLMKVVPVSLLQNMDKLIKQVVSIFVTKKKMSIHTKEILKNIYTEDVKKLSKLLEIDLLHRLK